MVLLVVIFIYESMVIEYQGYVSLNDTCFILFWYYFFDSNLELFYMYISLLYAVNYSLLPKVLYIQLLNILQ